VALPAAQDSPGSRSSVRLQADAHA
jgi:hypothetical protein